MPVTWNWSQWNSIGETVNPYATRSWQSLGGVCSSFWPDMPRLYIWPERHFAATGRPACSDKAPSIRSGPRCCATEWNRWFCCPRKNRRHPKQIGVIAIFITRCNLINPLTYHLLEWMLFRKPFIKFLKGRRMVNAANRMIVNRVANEPTIYLRERNRYPLRHFIEDLVLKYG